MRIGFGHDIHQLAVGKKLIIGGVELKFEKGFVAHSDGDVLYHALVDALLGALALGDIGGHFPNDDPQWKNKNSKHFVQHAYTLVQQKGYKLANIDAMVLAEAPKLKDHLVSMRKNIADLLNIELDQVSVKAGTNEKCDSIGRGEAIEATVALLIVRDT